MSNYNYDKFSSDNYDFNNAAGPAIGQKAPDFELENANGVKKRLLDFEGDYLVLELGSITCPLFHTRRGGMQKLQKKFSKVNFAILYVREAHPGEDIPAHDSFDDKKACAARLASEDGDTRETLVDNLGGEAHEAYGSMPNAVFVIDKDGLVRFKSEWSNPTATEKALKTLYSGKEMRVKSYFRPAKPWVVKNTVNRAGEGAGRDFFKSLPRLIWNNVIKRNLKVFFGRV